MTDEARPVNPTVADTAAVIERVSVDLCLAEEPAAFLAVLDELAADD